MRKLILLCVCMLSFAANAVGVKYHSDIGTKGTTVKSEYCKEIMAATNEVVASVVENYVINDVGTSSKTLMLTRGEFAKNLRMPDAYCDPDYGSYRLSTSNDIIISASLGHNQLARNVTVDSYQNS